MDVNKMLDELRQEREQINEVILSLERLAVGSGKRRGRPPAWLKAGQEGSADVDDSEAAATAPKKRGRQAGSKNKQKAEVES